MRCLQIALPEIAARPIRHNAVMPVETLYWASQRQWSCLAELMSKRWSIASRIWPRVRLQRT